MDPLFPFPTSFTTVIIPVAASAVVEGSAPRVQSVPQPTSRIIIVPEDNNFMVNGVSHTVDCSSLGTVHAVQWDGEKVYGEIEYKEVDGVRQPNYAFTDFSQFKSLLDAWWAAEHSYEPVPVDLTLIAYAPVMEIIPPPDSLLSEFDFGPSIADTLNTIVGA